MSNGHTIPHQGRVTMAVLLSRDFMGKDRFRSRFSLPVASEAFSTERKRVGTGEGRGLQQFLENPVHTSPRRPSTARRTLPKWTYQSIERYIVQSGRAHQGYTFELVGVGAPSVTWQLQRIVSRRAMRYNPVKRLGAKGKKPQYERAMAALEDGTPLAFKSEADQLTIHHWARRIHFILRMTAFDQEEHMDAWIAQHPRSAGPMAPIDREGAEPTTSNPAAGESGREWFKSMGWYALSDGLRVPMDPDAESFAFSQPRGMRLFKAYVNRGPDNVGLNFLNWPLEAASMYQQQCPQGTVPTEFTCDLRLEIYKW